MKLVVLKIENSLVFSFISSRAKDLRKEYIVLDYSMLLSSEK